MLSRAEDGCDAFAQLIPNLDSVQDGLVMILSYNFFGTIPLLPYAIAEVSL